jgi:hypothetical protein
MTREKSEAVTKFVDRAKSLPANNANRRESEKTLPRFNIKTFAQIRVIRGQAPLGSNPRSADLEICDTADLEVCATIY